MSRSTRRVALLTFPVPAVLWLACVCGCDPPARPSATSNPATDSSVVVYCSVDLAFAKPILQEFGQRSGLRVHPVFDTEAGKTTGLVNKLLAERARPRADVWWSGEIFGTMQLAAAGILESYEPASAADIDPKYRDAQDRWTAFGLRGRVLAYDPKRTHPEDVPHRWCDLADGRYRGRVVMADPRFGTTRGHMATLLALWGPEAMESFFEKLKANGCRLSDGNSQSVLLLSRGLADFAATDTDDVIAAQLRGDSVEAVYPDLDSPDSKKKTPGTLWIPCSAALVHGGPHPAPARKLLEYLVSAQIEEKLARSDSRNVPVRPVLRSKLGMTAPGEASVDYAVAAESLERSDQLVTSTLLP